MQAADKKAKQSLKFKWPSKNHGSWPSKQAYYSEGELLSNVCIHWYI